MIRRRVGLLLVALLLAAATASCVQLPQPLTGADPVRPALSRPEATTIMTNLRAVMTKADKTHNATLAGTVLTGQELEIATSEYAIGRRLGSKDGYGSPGLTVVSVASGPADPYPQTALIVSRFTDPLRKGDLELHQVTRSGAGAAWLVSLVGSTQAKTMVPLAVAVDGVVPQVPVSTAVNGVKPAGLGALLTSALKAPAGTEAKRFTTTPSKTWHDDPLDLDHSSLEQRYFARDGVAAVRAADGGTVVIATVARQRIVTMDSNWYFTYRKNPMKRLFPGQYTSSSDGFVDTFVVHLPAHGPLTVIGHESAWTQFTIS